MSDEASPQPQTPEASREAVAVPERRTFVGVMIGAGMTLFGALASIPLLRFALYPVFAKASEAAWSDVGPADSFASLSTPVQKLVTVASRDGWQETVAERPVYVTKDKQGQLRVLTAICPHLGCQVAWSADKQGFFCPCHGSFFAPDGTRISGPTPRSMDSLDTTVQNGQLKVRYQYFRQLLPDKEVSD
ncbi:MAG TPA: ubiquinol-cytochrome c reductase iron-sulfur subunit [Terriglobia bacterium]|jgi:menaquinol-cytochrome c reductase iron-sulfur subunit|nr:ubiquinol-cytochrome c reductase iron-sulfur subunit [Terriglobia bacterium]